ncbi:MAG: class I SAM-dependent methyltransferase [Bryobacterales bacterium]|nr:class I SAM-dependent methyltransferase [Bryobacterales bacterium]MBV9398575.1 class I SAM-dependent methyltransferase [Bryobacterales bacterium]
MNNSLLLPRVQERPRTIADRTRRVYDTLASIYPASTFFFHSKAHACALRHSRIRNGMRVLEVATGSGEMFRRLLKANPDGETFGLDLSPNMAAHTLRRARKDFPCVQAHCGAVDVRDLPFREGSFDAVVCCYLLELLAEDDIASTLREIRRVLRSGAVFSLVVIGQNVKMFNRLYAVCGSLAPAFWGRQVESDVPGMIRQAGLRIVTDQFVRQGFYPSRVLAARKR